jgi:hypothetical protein
LVFQKDENGGTADFKICETFVGFVEVTDASAAGIYKVLVKELQGFGQKDFYKLRGMGFDGAATMKVSCSTCCITLFYKINCS